MELWKRIITFWTVVAAFLIEVECFSSPLLSSSSSSSGIRQLTPQILVDERLSFSQYHSTTTTILSSLKDQDDDNNSNTSHDDTNLLSTRRRSILQSCLTLSSSSIMAITTSTIVSPISAFADDSNTGGSSSRYKLKEAPKAPITALVPVALQRILLERCLVLAIEMNKANSREQREAILEQIKAIIPEPDRNEDFEYARSTSTILNKQYNDLSYLRYHQIHNTLSCDLIRASMNIYMANLQYGDQVENSSSGSSGSGSDIKKLIRSGEGLPDVQRAIQSDLEDRFTLQRETQLKLNYAEKEIYSRSVNENELRTYFEDASDSFDKWLDKIRTDDVKKALQSALDGKVATIYDAYYEGYIPPRRDQYGRDISYRDYRD